MKYHDYLTGVNRTWNKADGLKELSHCRLAIMEEVGEIAGWYKKHIGYGKPKDESWKIGIKGEFGDLLFYLTKIADITGTEKEVEAFYEDDIGGNIEMLDELVGVDCVSTCSSMSKLAADLVDYGYNTSDFSDSLQHLLTALRVLIHYEGYELEDIQYSNLAKLKARHGDSFNKKSIMEEGRDRAKEDEALS